MTEQEQAAHTEDLPLEGDESGSVVGGSVSPAVRAEREIAKLEKEGFVQDTCTREGTRMVNPHTGKHITVKF
jgi:hypothetical protein